MFRRVLDAEMKVACKAGVEKKNKKAEREAVTEEEEKIMWDKNLLSLDVKQLSPSSVLFTFTMASYLEYVRKSTET